MAAPAGDSTVRLAVTLAAASPVMLTLTAALNTFDTPFRMDGMDRQSFVAWAVVAAVLAAAIGFAPWERAPRPERAFLVVLAVLPVYAVLHGWASGYFSTPLAGGTAVSEYFVLATLCGLTQRRGAVILYAGYVAAVGVLLGIGRSTSPALYTAQALAIPVAAVVGELIAWSTVGLQDAHRREGHRAGQLETLSRAVAMLRSDVTLEEASTHVRSLAEQLLDVTDVGVVLRHPSSDLVALGDLAITLTPALEEAIHAALDEGSDAPRTVSGDRDARGVLLLPLVGPAGTYGTLVAHCDAGSLDPFQAGLADLLASEAGAALHQLRIIESLADEATRDALTGLGNRRAVESLLGQLDPGDAVVVLDLDGFKPVNDTHGHAAGDELLRKLAAFLRHELRDVDEVARFGGDEFVAVLRAVGTADEATAILARVREGWAGGAPLSTVSIGAALHRAGASGDTTFDLADAALYRVKQAGGNGVAVAPDLPIS